MTAMLLDPVSRFLGRCTVSAYGVAYGDLPFQRTVDLVQQMAVGLGVVSIIGQDATQKIMSDTFSRIRSEFGAGEADCQTEYIDDLVERWERDFPPRPQPTSTDRPRVPSSTIDAFDWLVRQGDADRLAAWLEKHDPETVRALRSSTDVRRAA